MKRLIALALLFASIITFGTPVKSSLGTKGIATIDSEEPISVKSYIQDGLVALWDGIENVGWGEHDDNATAWVELVSGTPTPISSIGNFSQDALQMPVAKRVTLQAPSFSSLTARTGEVVLSDYYGYTGNRVYIEDNNANGGFSIQSNSNNYKSRLFATTPVGGFKFIFYSSVAQGTPFFTNIAFTQDAVTKAYTNGKLGDSHSKLSFTSFKSIGLGLRTNVQADFYCIRIYDRALSEDEIKRNYRVDKVRFGLP